MIPNVKHPYKVNVWAAISIHGLIKIHLFENNLNSDYYCEIIKNNLLLQARKFFGNKWIFQQDNDPKHKS